jgi:hypothetical protein
MFQCDKKTALVVIREVKICPDPQTAQKKKRVPVNKDREKAEKKS